MRTCGYFALASVVIICGGCRLIPQRTHISGGGVVLTHPKDVQNPPSISLSSQEEKTTIPGGSKITIEETKEVAQTANSVAVPAKRTTTIDIPKDKAAEIVKMEASTDAKGSSGFTQPPPPTPFQKSLAIWTYIGGAMFLLGVYFCTPWGGSNPRCGAIVAGGGLAMGISASLLDQFKLPGWFPSIFLVSIALALAVYYGYRVRHKQITNP
jgi:hypothetical protein